jgi:hypothetical protein
VVILNGPPADALKVRLEGKEASVGGDLSFDVPWSQVVDARLGQLAPMRGRASAIEALIEYLTREQKWGTP